MKSVLIEMHKRGMHVSGKSKHIRTYLVNSIVWCTLHVITVGAYISGFVSNGEFSVFRSKGYKHPISVFKVRSKIRNKYNRMSGKGMKDMLINVGK